MKRRVRRPAAQVILLSMLAGIAPVTQSAAIDSAPELALCRGNPEVIVALSRATTQARAVPERQRLTLQLSPEKTVVLPGVSPDLEKERAKTKGPTYAGLVRLDVPQSGTYRVGIDRDAWVDLATASGKLLDPAPEEGAFNCEGAQKILLYTLHTPGSYWLQVGLSSRRDIQLTIIRSD